MFAIGPYDRARQRLILAHDPLGIKPLYYAEGAWGLAFASELLALAASGLFDRTVDLRTLVRAWHLGRGAGRIDRLAAETAILAVSTDAKRGQIEHQEFEYIRHGTVNFLVALVVHSGQMHGWCLEHNDSQHLCQVLPQLFEYYPEVRRFHLIWDNGPSHIADHTHRFLRQYRHRVVFTPVHAFWLNQAELLLGAFAERYLKRGDWHSRQQLIEHLKASWPEYNCLYAHPFTWS